MIKRSKLHACPSYSCLLSLEEKPNSCGAVAMTSYSTSQALVYPGQHLMMKSCLADDIACYSRPGSPLNVVIDDEDDDKSDNDGSPYEDYTTAISIQETLKLEVYPSNLPSTKSCRVKFNPAVVVTLIPSHKDYSFEMKERIWTSTEELGINAVKSQMRCYLDDYALLNDGDDGMIDGSQHKFVPMGRLANTSQKV